MAYPLAVQFQILGPLAVVRDDTSLDLGGHRQRAVLARLLVDAGRVVPVGTLIEDVWEGRPPRTALKTLHKYVSELRRALRPSPGTDQAAAPLLTSGCGYVLDVVAGQLDAQAFEQQVAGARRAATAGDLATASVAFRESLDLWRGEVLADFADSLFAVAVRTGLHELRLAAIEERFDAELAFGRFSESATELAQLVETHPLRERLWALLMTALAGSGRAADALRAFQRFRSVLADELGLEPSEDLRRLEARIVRGEVGVALPATAISGSATVLVPSTAAAAPRFKITPPALPRCIDRRRLVDTALVAPVIVLAAPAGHGKTCLAAQLGAAAGGPVAWFTADELDRDRVGVVGQLVGALEVAWNNDGRALTRPLDDDTAVPLFGATFEKLTGPGCLVIDDAHLLPDDVLDAVLRTAVAAVPPDCHLVICTRSAAPPALIGARAMGRVVSLSAADLLFDEDECARLRGGPGCGAAIHARTGGWPLAVALLGERGCGDERSRLGPAEVGVLADVALADVAPQCRHLLVALSRLPRFPVRLLNRLGEPFTALSAFAHRRPGLLAGDEGWWSLREWLRTTLCSLPADARLVDVVVQGLIELDETELAAVLSLAESRYADAVPLVERLAADGMRRGRAAWVRGLIATVPTPARTLALDLLAAAAAQSMGIIDPTVSDAASEGVLVALRERARADSEGAWLRASALLASHYRMEADGRMFPVCEQALGDALTIADPERELLRRWTSDDAPGVAEMLRYYGHALLFADDPRPVERGRRLIATSLALLDRAERPTTSLRAWAKYFEALLFLTSAADAVRSVRRAVERVADGEHSDSAVRLAELATVEFLAGDRVAARRSLERARRVADRLKNHIAMAPLAAIEVALDVRDHGYSPRHSQRFDDVVAKLDDDRRLAHFTALIAAEFGIVLVQRGRPDVARGYLAQAEAAVGSTFFAHTSSLRCRRLRGLLLLADGRVAAGRDELTSLKRDALAQGRIALAAIVDDDVAAWRETTRQQPRVLHAAPAQAAG